VPQTVQANHVLLTRRWERCLSQSPFVLLQVVLAPCSDPVQAAWQVYMLLYAARKLAAERGLHVTAAPKPLSMHSGSGMHMHMSLVHDSKSAPADSSAASNVATMTGVTLA
jgi:glutamine synthetase